MVSFVIAVELEGMNCVMASELQLHQHSLIPSRSTLDRGKKQSMVQGRSKLQQPLK
jgi:hypothetical protein